MTPRFRDLFNWRGKTGRGAYVAWGLGLMAVKFTLDRWLAWTVLDEPWNWWSYWRPFINPLDRLSSGELHLALALLALALPFIAVGVILTVRRLRDAGWPLWMSAIFFLPSLNILFFAMIACAPSSGRAQPEVPPPPLDSWWARMARRLGLQNRAASAGFAVVFSVLLVVPLTALATLFFKDYGWGVFVALPFCLGMFAALFHSAAEPRTFGDCVGVAMLATLLCGVALIAVALEGAICVLMAAPLAAPVVFLGAVAGYYLQISRWGRAMESGRLYAVSWLVMPLVFAGEVRLSSAPAMVAVTTAVEIDAPADAVWRHVVTFAELPPPREWVFRSGIAYPIRATIRGEGVGAVRYCEFSTGPFVEPITVWDESRRLAFDVVQQPHPMRELSPYRDLDPPHLNGFFQSRRGEFVLTPLAGGRTLLEGTTWYTQNLWPGRYWRVWSDYLVHLIHRRVLTHIKSETEAERASVRATLPAE